MRGRPSSCRQEGKGALGQLVPPVARQNICYHYGLGRHTFHTPYVATTPGLSLRGIVSRDTGKVYADLPGIRGLANVEAMLDERDIDLVIVSSPDALHAEHAYAALAAGKHVLVDKPFATASD